MNGCHHYKQFSHSRWVAIIVTENLAGATPPTNAQPLPHQHVPEGYARHCACSSQPNRYSPAVARHISLQNRSVCADRTTIAEIAKREGKGERHIRILLPLAFSSPVLVEAVASDAAPKNLTTTLLSQQISNSWQAQNWIAQCPLCTKSGHSKGGWVPSNLSVMQFPAIHVVPRMPEFSAKSSAPRRDVLVYITNPTLACLENVAKASHYLTRQIDGRFHASS